MKTTGKAGLRMRRVQLRRVQLIWGAALFLSLLGTAWSGGTPEITISSTDLTAAEAGLEVATVTITRSVVTTSLLTVNIDITGTAVRNVDYMVPGVFGGMPNAISIPANQATTTLTVTPLADNIVEGEESVIFSLQPGTGYTVSPTDDSVQLSISDDVAEVNLTLVDGDASEQGRDPGTFMVSRSNNGNVAAPISVNIDITGTATRNVDYSVPGVFSGAPFSVTIPSNQLTATFDLTPFADNIVEGDETILVTLQPNATIYTEGTSTSALVTIADDVPEVNLTLIDGDASELGRDPGSFMVSRSSNGNLAAPISVNIDVTGTATRNADYAIPGLFGGAPFGVTIPANQLTATITLTPFTDNIVEGNETITVTLQPNATVYTEGAANSALITIADDVAEVNLTLVDGNAAEQGLDPGSFMVSRSSNGNLAAPISVNLDITGTATRNADYSSPGVFGGAPFGVTIPANQLTATITLTPFADNIIEGDETITVTLQPNVTVYTEGAASSALITIADDVAEVNLTLVDGNAAEQDLDPGSFMVTRSNNGNIAAPISVNLDLTGTATRTLDYTTVGIFGGAPFAVTIPANQLMATFEITPRSDNPDDEGDETVEVTLQSGSTYTVGASTMATIVIADLIDFLFTDSFEATVIKSCGIEKAIVADPGRFFDQGSSVLDLLTGLQWAKCGIEGVFDWADGSCFMTAALETSEERLQDFNAGYLGDNSGFQDWRFPMASEVQSLGVPACKGRVVRED